VASHAVLPFDGPDTDPWVRDFRDRVVSYDGLYRFAVDRYGAPTSCEGEVNMEFDGARFGRIVLDFASGVAYTVETQPPEASVRVLSSAGGFADPEAVREAVAAYAADIGLDLDWTAPEVATEDGLEMRTFWDPEPGLNASVTLVFSGGALVRVRVGLAP